MTATFVNCFRSVSPGSKRASRSSVENGVRLEAVFLCDLPDGPLLVLIDSLNISARIRLGLTCRRLHYLVETRWISLRSLDTVEIFPPRRRLVTIPTLRLQRALDFVSTRMHALSKVVFYGRICSTDERPLTRGRAAGLPRSGTKPLRFICTFLESVSSTLQALEINSCFVLRPNDSGVLVGDLRDLSIEVNALLKPGLAKLTHLKRFAFVSNCLTCGDMLTAITPEIEAIELVENPFDTSSLVKLLSQSEGVRQLRLTGQNTTASRSTGVTGELLEAIKSLRALELLELSDFSRDAVPASVSGRDLKNMLVSSSFASSLTHLDLTWNCLMRGRTTTFALDDILILGNLRHLNVSGHKFKPDDLQILCNLTKLTFLNISDTNCGLTTYVTGSVLESLARSLINLQEFNVGDVRKASQQQLMALTGLRLLTDLYFATETVSKELFLALGTNLRSLRSVFIRTRAKTVDDQSLAEFARSTPAMRVFHLINSNITNLGLNRLVQDGLWEDVRGFDVTGSSVTRIGVAFFLDARPKLRNETDPDLVQRYSAPTR